jgi:hypothetical protein
MLICLLPKPPIDFFSIKKRSGKKKIFVTILVLINLGLDPDPEGIRIQQQTGSGSVFRKIPGSRCALSELNTDPKHWLMWVTGYASPFLATDEDGLKEAEDPRLNVNSSKF